VAKTILTLRDPGNPNLPGETKEFDYVGGIMGGGNNPLLTFFNEDVGSDGDPNPKPFYAIATDRVYSVETPEYHRPAQKPVDLVVPTRRM
jgi:hypothetical protein